MGCIELYAACYGRGEAAVDALRRILAWYRRRIRGGMVVWTRAKVRRALASYAEAHGCWSEEKIERVLRGEGGVDMRKIMRNVRRIGTTWYGSAGAGDSH